MARVVLRVLGVDPRVDLLGFDCDALDAGSGVIVASASTDRIRHQRMQCLPVAVRYGWRQLAEDLGDMFLGHRSDRIVAQSAADPLQERATVFARVFGEGE